MKLINRFIEKVGEVSPVKLSIVAVLIAFYLYALHISTNRLSVLMWGAIVTIVALLCSFSVKTFMIAGSSLFVSIYSALILAFEISIDSEILVLQALSVMLAVYCLFLSLSYSKRFQYITMTKRWLGSCVTLLINGFAMIIISTLTTSVFIPIFLGVVIASCQSILWFRKPKPNKKKSLKNTQK